MRAIWNALTRLPTGLNSEAEDVLTYQALED